MGGRCQPNRGCLQTIPPGQRLSTRVSPSATVIRRSNRQRSETVNELDILDQASRELPGAMAAIDAGYAATGSYAQGARRLLEPVISKSREAVLRAAALRADDVMNPEGRRRLLNAMPGELMTATTDQLEQAELNLELLEGAHLTAILHHDHKDDANLRFELTNYIAGIKPETAGATLVGIAANPRYSTFMAGPMGDSLVARYGLKDPEVFRKTALQSLAVNGTPEQQARSRALAEMPAARRALGLARGGRDFVIEHLKRPVAPNPSEALR
jgi:hypothetical protein